MELTVVVIVVVVTVIVVVIIVVVVLIDLKTRDAIIQSNNRFTFVW
tara:strand:+ start:829 stop:966 length:138 start_codon:yes stop_codon:yes gene_type:complete